MSLREQLSRLKSQEVQVQVQGIANADDLESMTLKAVERKVLMVLGVTTLTEFSKIEALTTEQATKLQAANVMDNKNDLFDVVLTLQDKVAEKLKGDTFTFYSSGKAIGVRKDGTAQCTWIPINVYNAIKNSSEVTLHAYTKGDSADWKQEKYQVQA